jgi:hypothetical protein
VSENRAGHIALHRHADFIECSCGHLAVTDSDFLQHVEEMDRRWQAEQDDVCEDCGGRFIRGTHYCFGAAPRVVTT